jgi:transmembrane sensor
MNTRDAPKSHEIPPERLAEAGVWIARLHGDERDRGLENGFWQWLRANPMNAKAFELATEVWEDTANLRRVIPFAPSVIPKRRLRFPVALSTVATAAASTVVLVILAAIFVHSHGVSTVVGEQRMLSLDDGSRIYLNTATRVVVNYDKRTRKVELEAGEALFDVAKRPNWPFIVTAGDRQVRALGTSFIVRRDHGRLAVTLVEGRVTVSPSSVADSSSTPDSPNPGAVSYRPSEQQSFTLKAGERLIFIAGKAAQLDSPPLDKATAWRRGQVIFDDTPLSAAVPEMNRYSPVKVIVIERPESATMLINGLFQAGDSASFAQAVAQTYGLRVVEHGNEIDLLGVPKPVARRAP